MKGKRGIVVVVAVLTVLLAACGGGRVGELSAEQYNDAPLTVVVPQGVSSTAVADAAEKALRGRKWEVVSRSDEEVVGHLAHRDYDARVNIVIADGLATLFSDATYDGPRQEGAAPAVPYGWLKNLQSDIGALLQP